MKIVLLIIIGALGIGGVVIALDILFPSITSKQVTLMKFTFAIIFTLIVVKFLSSQEKDKQDKKNEIDNFLK
jgi:hypothetical protein